MRKTRAYGRAVTPYSGVRESGVNCSSLKLFISCHEGRGHILSDPIHSLIWDASAILEDPAFPNTITWNTDGSVTRVADPLGPEVIANLDPTPYSGPTISFASSKVYLFMAVGKVLGDAISRVAIGDINDNVGYSVPAGFGMSDGTLNQTLGSGFHCAIGNSVTPQRRITTGDDSDLWSVGAGQYVVTLAKWTPASGIVYEARNLDTGVTIIAADTYTATDDPTPFSANPCLRFSGYALFGFALFEFSSFPAWIDTAIYWMANQWRHAGLGKPRYIYPMLRSYTG